MNPKSNCSMIVLLEQRGVKHVVVTYAMRAPVWMKIPQMQEAAHDGA
jgi:hypothetical protein